MGGLRFGGEEEEVERRTEKEREGGDEMLVVRVKTVVCEIDGIGVVEEGV